MEMGWKRDDDDDEEGKEARVDCVSFSVV